MNPFDEFHEPEKPKTSKGTPYDANSPSDLMRKTARTIGEDFEDNIKEQGGWGISPETREFFQGDDKSTPLGQLQALPADALDLGYRGLQSVGAGAEAVLKQFGEPGRQVAGAIEALPMHDLSFVAPRPPKYYTAKNAKGEDIHFEVPADATEADIKAAGAKATGNDAYHEATIDPLKPEENSPYREHIATPVPEEADAKTAWFDKADELAAEEAADTQPYQQAQVEDERPAPVPPKEENPYANADSRPDIMGGDDAGPPFDPVAALTKALEAARPLTEEQRLIYKQARAEKLAALRKAKAAGSGEAGFHTQLSALKGAMPKVDFTPIRDMFTQENIDSFFNTIKDHPDLQGFEGINAQSGLTKLLQGQVPQASELGQLAKAFPSDFIQSLVKNKGMLREFDGQGEFFRGEDVTSTGPIYNLHPEKKPVDPDKWVYQKGQGDLFREEPSFTRKPKDPAGDQIEMFPGEDTTSTGPIRNLLPEPKVADPDKWKYVKGQGDFFREEPSFVKKAKEVNPEGQIEMFPGQDVTSTGPIRNLLPEEKPVDPDKYVKIKGQGDFFREEPSFTKPGRSGGSGGSDGNSSFINNLINFPRAIVSTVDLSIPLRQGVFMVSRPEWYKSFVSMIKQAGSERYYQAVQSSIRARPSFPLMEKAGLAITDKGLDIMKRPEQFRSTWAEKIPVFKHLVNFSERAAVGFSNQLRADVFDSILKQYDKLGIDISADDKLLKGIGKYINAASGRGAVPFGKTGTIASDVFFSPQLLKSRIDLLNPATYLLEKDPVLRKNKLRDLAGFGSIATSVVGLAKLFGAEVGTDPLSTKWGKIKIGNIYEDIWGGFQQFAHLAAVLAMNERTSNTGKKVEFGKGYKPETRASTIGRFLRSKESPAASLVHDYLEGSDYVGDKFELSKALIKRLTPFSSQDLYAGYNDSGASGVALTTPALFGAGVSVQPPKGKKNEAVNPFDDLSATAAPLKTEQKAGNPFDEYK